MGPPGWKEHAASTTQSTRGAFSGVRRRGNAARLLLSRRTWGNFMASVGDCVVLLKPPSQRQTVAACALPLSPSCCSASQPEVTFGSAPAAVNRAVIMAGGSAGLPDPKLARFFSRWAGLVPPCTRGGGALPACPPARQPARQLARRSVTGTMANCGGASEEGKASGVGSEEAGACWLLLAGWFRHLLCRDGIPSAERGGQIVAVRMLGNYSSHQP